MRHIRVLFVVVFLLLAFEQGQCNDNKDDNSHPKSPHPRGPHFPAIPCRPENSTETPENTIDCDVAIVGAGIGGLYSAWRILSDNSTQDINICIFEKQNYIGGRIRSISGDEVPELGDLVIDVGAYRFENNQHEIVSSLVNDIYDLQNYCYWRRVASDPSNSTCLEQFRVMIYLRDQRFTMEELVNDSSILPYNLREDEHWGGSTGRSFPENDLNPIPMNLFPELDTTLIKNGTKAERYAEARRLLDLYQDKTINGRNIGDTSPIIASGLPKNHSTEYKSLLNDLASTFDYRKISTLYSEIRLTLMERATGESDLRVIVDSEGNLLGYESFLKLMHQDIENWGAKVHFVHELVELEKSNNPTYPLTLKMKNGAISRAKEVILNIPKKALERIGKTNPVWSSPRDPRVIDALNHIHEVDTTKLYLVYEDAWWINLGLEVGQTACGLFCSFGFMTYNDGPIICNRTDSGTLINGSCRGALQISYQFGGLNTLYYLGLLKNKSEPLAVIRPGSDDEDIMYKLHDELISLHEHLISPETEIPLPTMLVMGLWDIDWLGGGFHVQTPGNKIHPPSDYQELLSNPAENIYLANEAYGPVPAWAEGSLIMAEKALKSMGYKRPEFIDEEYYNTFVARS